MKKQEIIKQAYGEHWDKVCEYVDEKGWCHGYFGIQMQELQGIPKPKNEPTKWLPKSLEGLEDNNGWIKIEKSEDLPKENGEYWTLRKNGIMIKEHFYLSNPFDWTIFYNVTHYKPIEKPKPPIY